MEWVQTRFDDGFGNRLSAAAMRAGVPLGIYARTVMAGATAARHPDLTYPTPRKPHTLQAWLFHDFAHASGWDDLADRLSVKGYKLAACGGGLILCTMEGERLCKASDIGQPYRALIRRFGTPFPNHPHEHLARRHAVQTTLPL